MTKPNTGNWHGIERTMHYQPGDTGFELVTGKQRYNRALYTSGGSFRLEGGDIPAFALYNAGMAGNLKLGLIIGNQSKWLSEASGITVNYNSGQLRYVITDALLGGGSITITATTSRDEESALFKISASGIPPNAELLAAYGGASGLILEHGGDYGSVPESSFDLIPGNCSSNIFVIKKTAFKLNYGGGRTLSQVEGIFPAEMKLKLSAADKMQSPSALYSSIAGSMSLVTGRGSLRNGKSLYIRLSNPLKARPSSPKKIHSVFEKTVKDRLALADRIHVKTPDAYINSLGGALAYAAEGLWTGKYFAGSAVSLRDMANKTYAPYLGGILGWNDRVRTHITTIAKIIELAEQNTRHDTTADLSRVKSLQKDEGLLFYSGVLKYIRWSGDLDLARQIWPQLKSHLAWEKSTFDKDGDALYDAYNTLDDSPTLYYSGGGVAYSSALNYEANIAAASLAKLIGQDGSSFLLEAERIKQAIGSRLWQPDSGVSAESSDAAGRRLKHPSPALWSIYHTINSGVLTNTQAFQSSRYVDTDFPRIAVKAGGLLEQGLYVLPTSTWQPYVPGVNNVTMYDQQQLALSYWIAGRANEAYTLLKSAVTESLFLGNAPGGFQKTSFYDAQAGISVRDYTSSVASTAAALVQGLFGISPDAGTDTLTIRPGFPGSWNQAEIKLPELSYSFNRQGLTDKYIINNSFKKSQVLRFIVPANSVALRSVTVNGQRANWKSTLQGAGGPMMEIVAPKEKHIEIEINWEGLLPDMPMVKQAVSGAPFGVSFALARIEDYADPQHVLSGIRIVDQHSLNVDRLLATGPATLFLKLRQRDFSWWQPIPLNIKPELEITYAEQSLPGLRFKVISNEGITKRGFIRVNPGVREYVVPLEINKGETREINVPAGFTLSGTNRVRIEYSHGKVFEQDIVNWAGTNDNYAFEKIDLKPYFNDKVSAVFKNRYLKPRTSAISMSVPTQGVGNALTPNVVPNIDDSGIRRMAFTSGQIVLPNRVPLATPGVASVNNISFTSAFSNYPDSLSIPLRGHASHAYLMLAGSTSAMQSQMVNALVRVSYTDNTSDILELKNPQNWWPIEQDYYVDGSAFITGQPMPFRVYLKSGMTGRNVTNYSIINNFSKRVIDGGAATVADIVLNPAKELKELKLIPVANDIVIGLMSLTLQR